MSKATHYMSDETLRDYARWLELDAATLAGLRDGSLVAVPVEHPEPLALLRAIHDAHTAGGKRLYGRDMQIIWRKAVEAAAQEAGRG